MSAEFDAFILHGTWELVPSSPHQKIVVGLIGLSGNLMAVLSGTTSFVANSSAVSLEERQLVD